MSNIIDSIQLSGVTYTLSAQTSGEGKSVEAGRGIDVASGTSAYTVSFNLPISAGTGSNSIVEGATAAGGNYSHAEGYGAIANGDYSHAEGNFTAADGNYSHAEGYLTTADGNYSHAEGNYTVTNNQSEHASGQYNVSSKANNTFGNSGNTLFSVGNGTSYNARHNAFEIRQNGDIYITSGGTDIKLQDNLGGGGNPTVELTQAEYDALVSAGTVSADTFYIITDAQPVDISNYWTSAQTNSAINAAVSGKVDTSTITSSVTSASTNSEIPTAKAVYDAVGSGGGGSITIDPSLDSGSPNAVANSAITNAINSKQDSSKLPTYIVSNWNYDKSTHKVSVGMTLKSNGGAMNVNHSVITINNQDIFNNTNVSNLSLVETSAITTSVTSASTDAQVPSAKAVYDAIQEGGGGSSITVDTALDSGSTNPVENRVIYNKIDEVEQVTAAALNNINDRLSEDEEVTAAALNNINDTIGNINTILESI